MIESGQIYKHYKGGMYEIISAAIHTETNEYLIVYKSLEDNRVWCRPHHMFTEVLNVSENIGIPRFELVVEDASYIDSFYKDIFEEYVSTKTILAKLMSENDINSTVNGVPAFVLDYTLEDGTPANLSLSAGLVGKAYIIKENDRYYYKDKEDFEKHYKKEIPF